MKYAGVGLALYFGLTSVGGFNELQAHLPPAMFSWSNVGVSQIFAWFIAGVGATFSTQYVIQAINTVETRQKSQIASFSAAVLLIPFGIATDDKSLGALAIGLGAYLLKLMVLAVALPIGETAVAKMRVFRYPVFLGGAFAAAALAVFLLFVSQSF